MTNRSMARHAAGSSWWVRALLAAFVPALMALLAACADGGPTTGPTPVASVTVLPAEWQLAPGASHRLNAVAKDAAGQVLADRLVTWRSADTTRVRVAVDGTVTAVRPGTVVVTATVEGREGTARIVVPQPPPGPVVEVYVTPNFAELHPGQAMGVTAVAVDASGEMVHGLPVTWSVSDDHVLMLEPNTQVRALTPGVARVNATVAGHAGSALFHVLHPTPLVNSLSPATVPVGSGITEVVIKGAGFTRQSVVRVGGVAVPANWVTGGELRAQVPADRFAAVGLLPVSVVNPTPGGGASNVLSLQVTSPAGVQYVYIDGGGHVWPGEVVQLAARPVDVANQPVPGVPVTWTSLNPAVATVDGAGKVTAVAPGNAEITATAGGVSNRTLVMAVAPPAADLLFDDGVFVYRTSVGAQPEVRRLLEGTDAAVSPDGTRLAFVRAAPGGTEIWVADISGANARRVSAGGTVDDQPAWSPDGQWLAFRSERSGWSDIWVMDANGANARNLTGGDVRVGVLIAQHPAWSPDGTTIVYSLENRTFVPVASSIMTVRVADGVRIRLVDGTGLREHPTYVQGGAAIMARHVTAAGAHMVAWYKADTGEMYVLPNHGAVAYAPVLSAAGDWLAFTTTAAAGWSELVVVGGGMQGRRLPRTPLVPTGAARNAAWVIR